MLESMRIKDRRYLEIAELSLSTLRRPPLSCQNPHARARPPPQHQISTMARRRDAHTKTHTKSTPGGRKKNGTH